MQKIAAIDAGSNALRLVVASLDDAWLVEPLDPSAILSGWDMMFLATIFLMRDPSEENLTTKTALIPLQ